MALAGYVCLHCGQWVRMSFILGKPHCSVASLARVAALYFSCQCGQGANAAASGSLHGQRVLFPLGTLNPTQGENWF